MRKYFIVFFIAFLITSSFAVSVNSQNISLKEIYQKKQEALKSLNIEEAEKYLSKDIIKTIKKEKDPKGALFLLNYLSPVEYSTGQEIFSDSEASMEITGKARNPKLKGAYSSFKGEIKFKQENGVWKISEEDINYDNE